MTPEQLIAFISERKWIAIAAFAIGLIVRLLKSDTKLPIDIPTQYRVWLALGLGAAAGALDKLGNMDGVTWTSAVVQGLTAAVLAILGHATVIESLRGGRELNIPGLIKPGAPPGPGKPITLSPPPPTVNTSIPPVSRAIFAMGACVLASCALFTHDNAPKTILSIKDIACIAEHAFVNDATLNTICDFLTVEQQQAAHQQASAMRTGLTKARATQGDGGACMPDGATP